MCVILTFVMKMRYCIYVRFQSMYVCTKVRSLQLQTVRSLLQCSAGVGVDAFFHALYTRKSSRTIALIGTGCSEVTEHLAQIVPYWNILQVRRQADSPLLEHTAGEKADRNR